VVFKKDDAYTIFFYFEREDSGSRPDKMTAVGLVTGSAVSYVKIQTIATEGVSIYMKLYRKTERTGSNDTVYLGYSIIFGTHHFIINYYYISDLNWITPVRDQAR